MLLLKPLIYRAGYLAVTLVEEEGLSKPGTVFSDPPIHCVWLYYLLQQTLLDLWNFEAYLKFKALWHLPRSVPELFLYFRARTLLQGVHCARSRVCL